MIFYKTFFINTIILKHKNVLLRYLRPLHKKFNLAPLCRGRGGWLASLPTPPPPLYVRYSVEVKRVFWQTATGNAICKVNETTQTKKNVIEVCQRVRTLYWSLHFSHSLSPLSLSFTHTNTNILSLSLSLSVYRDNIFVKRSIPTVGFAHMGNNPTTKIRRGCSNHYANTPNLASWFWRLP